MTPSGPPTSVSDFPVVGPSESPPSPRSLRMQTLAAVALAVWRIAERSPADLGWDLLFLVALIWLLDLYVRPAKLRAWLMPVGVLALFAAYVLRHLPMLVAHLHHNL